MAGNVSSITTMMDRLLKTPEHSPLTLEGMPPEIKNQIYGHLLDSKACDKSLDDNSEIKPHFHPNILRVNKKTYKEGHGILYGSSGPVITAALYMADGEDALKRGMVPFRSTKYTRSIAGRQLHIVVKPTFVSPSKRKPCVFVLVGMDNIKSFYRFLKLLNWAENDGRGISYEFNFEPCKNVLETASTSPGGDLQVHKDLVDLFSGLRASLQTCNTKGLTDRSVEAAFLQKLNNKVLWLQAESLEFWTNCLALYNKAAQLSAEGSFDAALKYHEYIMQVYKLSCGNNSSLQGPDASLEGSFLSRFMTLIAAIHVSRAMLYLLGSFSAKHKGNLKETICMEMFGAVLAANEAMVDEMGETIATLMIPKDMTAAIWKTIAVLRMVCGDSVRKISAAWGSAAVWTEDEEKKAKLEQLEFCALTTDLRDTPQIERAMRIAVAKMYIPHLSFPVLPWGEHTPFDSVSVLNERFLLRELKYTGPLYPNGIQGISGESTRPGSSVPAIHGGKVDSKHCKAVLKGLHNCTTKYRRVCDFTIWIGQDGFFFKGSDSIMRDMGKPPSNMYMSSPFDLNPILFF
ncbi:hypothetical protein TWF718_003002 [Orbilia javanica]|uniref:Uncharacterized protein n=1 Tax=Orbilia javanica TaxID=47235 RepID=A0AAN8MF38_9PEZI